MCERSVGFMLIILDYVLSLEVLLVARHRRREPVLRELRHPFILLVRLGLRVLYSTLLARARRGCVKELPDDDHQLSSTKRRETRL